MGNRKAKNDIAPAIRASFLRGFEKYCRKKGITYSDAMAEMIEAEGLGYVLDRVSKFTVRENSVNGKVDHDHTHKHTHEAISETAQWIEGMLGGDTQSETKEPSTH